MDCVLIFADLFSATLTSCIVDFKWIPYNKWCTISNKMLRYQLKFLSRSPPLSRSPSPSDIRVNVYWFMSLVFSLSAALFATLVEQWVRDYMHVFQ
ncbi:hypothetical protein EDB92DRAFT_632994 [Lactarius akahatsu]|uniref:DUF6535 domain-containing protein n=1 Tax=Lactarius akahatsu TaxID=416441 RepID=A0AAD4Q8B8_9AGAM|nr:hypothetical protein EDB92DRAFT_632994 [Lactarius akahatsu]